MFSEEISSKKRGPRKRKEGGGGAPGRKPGSNAGARRGRKPAALIAAERASEQERMGGMMQQGDVSLDLSNSQMIDESTIPHSGGVTPAGGSGAAVSPDSRGPSDDEKPLVGLVAADADNDNSNITLPNVNSGDEVRANHFEL